MRPALFFWALLAAPSAPPAPFPAETWWSRYAVLHFGGPTLVAGQFEQFEEDQATSQPGKIEVCEKAERKDRFCGLKWGVFNTARVPEFWVVHEMEFYWDAQCKVSFPPGLPKTSQQNTYSPFADKVAGNVWDQDESSWWVSECNVLLQGCMPWSHWVGMVISDTATPVIVDPLQPYANLRCIRMLQSPNATRSSRSVATVMWANDTDFGYEVINHYDDLSGGFWNTRPAQEAQLWRVWNADPTSRPWEVGEILFYSDLFCEKEVVGVPISSDSFGVPTYMEEETECYQWIVRGCRAIPGCDCDGYLASFAFDGLRLPGVPLPVPLPGFWKAPCHPWTGCEREEAWIGMDFGDQPRVVNCIRIHQPTHEGWPDFGYPTFSSRLILQSWTGFVWQSEKFFSGIGHGNWSDTRPKSGFAWRIANFDRIPEAWDIHELAFYEDVNCGIVSQYTGDGGVSLGGIPGTPISSNPAMRFSEQERACRLIKGSCGQLAFDLDTLTAWTSHCNPCGQREAWIGLLFRTKPRDVKCFRVFQGTSRLRRTEALELGMFNGDEWQVERFEAGIGGGTWNYRPAQSYTAWRMLGTSETVEPWTVAGLHFYRDAQCAGPAIEEPVLGCGSTPRNPIENAFDFDPEGITEWVASCAPPRLGAEGCAPGAAWIGIQGRSPTEIGVKCVRLKQHRLRAKQMDTAILEVFDGIKWLKAEGADAFMQLGGGSWQTLPGAQGSMWRLIAEPLPGGFGVGFSEVGFYRTPDCTGRPVEPNWPNVAPISSGFSTAREINAETGYSAHFVVMGESGVAEPGAAFDGDFSTFWCDINLLNSPTWYAWLGMDMTSQVTDVQCVRFAAAPIKSLQPAWAELQGWSGDRWTQGALIEALPTLAIRVPAPSAGGWQRRPAPPRSMWRLQTVETQVGWEVVEIELYVRVDCGDQPLSPWHAFASARSTESGVGAGGHFLPLLAFDGLVSTRWKADCPPDGCEGGEAWIGAGFLEAQSVKCLKFYQSGRHERQARAVALAAWMGDRWEVSATYDGLGGNSWNMRPAAPDTMWRVTFIEENEEKCATMPTVPSYSRSWGVSELKFFADDDCKEQLMGEAIASGSWEDTASMDRVDEEMALRFAPSMATDGSDLTFWSANCRSTTESPRAQCLEGEEWIGLDVGQANGGVPVEVRCVKLHQSRAMQKHCCSPAKNLRLDRWNGSAWAETTWRHLPEDGATPMHIQGGFSNLGECPSLADKITGKTEGPNPGVWESRMRRQSDTCEIPLSGAIKLLADRMCQKHPICQEAGFGKTMFNCCPINLDTSVSKCCCEIPRWKIFEDQWDLGIDRMPIEPFPVIGIEYVIIRMVTVMPWCGVMLTLLFYAVASMPKPLDHRTSKYRFWNAACGPLQRWLKGNSLHAMVFSFLIHKAPREKVHTTLAKRACVVFGGFFFGGSVVWIMLAYIISEVILKVLLVISIIIRKAKSKYVPTEPAQKKRLCIVLAIPFAADSKGIKVPKLAEILSGIAKGAGATLIALIRAIFDIILLRFAMMNMGIVDIQVSVPEIMERVPTLPLDMEWLTGTLYDILAAAGYLFMEIFTQLFEGVPRCEGPVLTFSGMWLVGITLILLKFLNYDYFGLLISVKHTLMKTRPLFQKTSFVSLTLGFQAVVFMLMQMVMLLFSRALSLLFGVSVFPVAPSAGWNCPYEGETASILIGRIFLIIMGVLSMFVTFLCANGHFLGKQKITGDFGRKCGMDLQGLDVDAKENAEDEDASNLIRWGTALSMFPTSCGFWFDNWNIQGFLIEERARIYAENLNYPDLCEVCGTRHIPYADIMKATAMQVSLAWQLFPFIGPIVGKACEACNNPPLYYRGTKLKCFWHAPNMKEVSETKEKKMDGGSKAKYYAVLAVAFLKDKGIPCLQRFVGVGMYATIVYFTHAIDKNNLERMAVEMFKMVMMLASLVGYLECLFPLLVLVALGASLFLVKKKLDAQPKKSGKSKFKGTAEQIAEKELAKPTLWPMIGQVFHGAFFGSAMGIFLLGQWPDTSKNNIQLISAAAGYLESVFAVTMAFLFELVPGGRMAATLFFVVYSVFLSLGIAAFAGYGFHFSVKALIATGAGIILLYVSAMAFRPPPVGEDGVKQPSATLPLLTSFRILPGFFGVFAGVFAGVMPYEMIQNVFGPYNGFCTSAGLTIIFGLIYSFMTEVLGERKPGQMAIAVGTITTILIGFFHWFVGAVIGSVVASIVGSYFERKMMEEVDHMNLEPPRYTKSKVMSATSLVRQAPENEPEVLALMGTPTVVRAETPTRNKDSLGQIAFDDAADKEEQLLALREAAAADAQSTELALAPPSALALPGAPAEGNALRAAQKMTTRRKKYGLGGQAQGLVPVQGAPNFQPGMGRWKGPDGTAPEEEDALTLSPTSPAASQALTLPTSTTNLQESTRRAALDGVRRQKVTREEQFRKAKTEEERAREKKLKKKAATAEQVQEAVVNTAETVANAAASAAAYAAVDAMDG